MWTPTLMAVNLDEQGGNGQGPHSLPCHAHFCSIIATCSRWWDRSSPRQSWSSAMVDISRLLVDLSSSLSPPWLLKRHALAHFGDVLSVAAGRGLQLDTLVWVHQGSSSSLLHCSVLLFLTILNSLQIRTILSVAFTQKHLPISSHPSKRMSRRKSRKPMSFTTETSTIAPSHQETKRGSSGLVGCVGSRSFYLCPTAFTCFWAPPLWTLSKWSKPLISPVSLSVATKCSTALPQQRLGGCSGLWAQEEGAWLASTRQATKSWPFKNQRNMHGAFPDELKRPWKAKIWGLLWKYYGFFFLK